MEKKAIIRKENRSFWMGVAILMIIMCHIQYTCYDDRFFMRILRFFFKNGEFGVEIFLFLSVVGLCYSVDAHSIRKFYVNRVKRLFPMYFFFLLFSLFFLGQDRHFGIYVLYQLTGLANFVGNPFNEWYIPAVILIYALFPALMRIVNYICRFGMIYGLLTVILFILIYPLTNDIITPYFARRLYLIVLGILVYQSSMRNKGIGVLFPLSIIASVQLFLPSCYTAFLYVPLLIVVIDKYVQVLPARAFFSWIGKHSLEVYLGQTLGIIYFCSQSELSVSIKLIMGIIITIVSAVVMYYGHSLFYKLVRV